MKQMVSLTAHAQTQIPSHHPLLSQLVNVSAAFAPCSSLIPARPSVGRARDRRFRCTLTEFGSGFGWQRGEHFTCTAFWTAWQI